MRRTKKRKVFVAINLDDKSKKFLIRKIAKLKERFPSFHWLDVDNCHLTVLFLGHLDDQQLVDISLSLRDCLESKKGSFDVFLGRLIWAPRLNSAKMIWLQGERSDKLQELRMLVEEACDRVDYKKEVKGFRPHLTLARFGVKNVDASDQDFLNEVNFDFSLPVERLDLMESFKTKEGWFYQSLDSFLLN